MADNCRNAVSAAGPHSCAKRAEQEQRLSRVMSGRVTRAIIPGSHNGVLAALRLQTRRLETSLGLPNNYRPFVFFKVPVTVRVIGGDPPTPVTVKT